MADLKQILLPLAAGCTGRGVRLRSLSLDECARVRESVAHELGPDGTMAQYNLRNGICSVAAMVAEVTEKDAFKKAKDLVEATWKKVTRQELEENAKAYFSTSDMDALVKVFQKTHSVTEKDVEAILGEVQLVTGD